MRLLSLLEDPQVFGFTQKLNPMTTRLYRKLLMTHVVHPRLASVLDIGCGIGAHRPLFTSQQYTGIDINPDYVSMARKTYGDLFQVMDAGQLDFADDTFDAVFTAATCHHLADHAVEGMVREALRVVKPGGALHLIDPIVPTSQRALVKRAMFASDRGRHQRTIRQLTEIVARQARIAVVDVRASVLHDVCYIRVAS
jgi:SAM-dependent methyltransferase